MSDLSPGATPPAPTPPDIGPDRKKRARSGQSCSSERSLKAPRLFLSPPTTRESTPGINLEYVPYHDRHDNGDPGTTSPTHMNIVEREKRKAADSHSPIVLPKGPAIHPDRLALLMGRTALSTSPHRPVKPLPRNKSTNTPNNNPSSSHSSLSTPTNSTPSHIRRSKQPETSQEGSAKHSSGWLLPGNASRGPVMHHDRAALVAGPVSAALGTDKASKQRPLNRRGPRGGKGRKGKGGSHPLSTAPSTATNDSDRRSPGPSRNAPLAPHLSILYAEYVDAGVQAALADLAYASKTTGLDRTTLALNLLSYRDYLRAQLSCTSPVFKSATTLLRPPRRLMELIVDEGARTVGSPRGRLPQGFARHEVQARWRGDADDLYRWFSAR